MVKDVRLASLGCRVGHGGLQVKLPFKAPPPGNEPDQGILQNPLPEMGGGWVPQHGRFSRGSDSEHAQLPTTTPWYISAARNPKPWLKPPHPCQALQALFRIGGFGGFGLRDAETLKLIDMSCKP